MDIVALQILNSQILWALFALSVLFGAIAQRTHFCSMGAVAGLYCQIFRLERAPQ
jgi:hypothetical protein